MAGHGQFLPGRAASRGPKGSSRRRAPLLPPRTAGRSPLSQRREKPEVPGGPHPSALAAQPQGGARGGGPGRAEALPVPGFRLRVPEEDRRAIGGAAARRDFQTRTMASCWWRWRRGCSWRPAARSPGPGSPDRAGPCGPRPAATACAQVRPGRACRSGRRGQPRNDSGGWNEWARATCVPGGGPRGRAGMGPGAQRGGPAARWDAEGWARGVCLPKSGRPARDCRAVSWGPGSILGLARES